MNGIGWGLIGPGRIAHRLADALSAVDGARLVAVAGRDAGRAADFARQWSATGAAVEAFGDVAAMLAHPGVQVVYVATPHPAHDAAVRAALDAGRHVLCEKPLTVDADRAQLLVDQARRRGRFLMEAMWTRFLPAHRRAREWLRAGAIGRVRRLTASFCIDLPLDPQGRHLDPAQGGGTLLDLGVYPIALSRWLMAADGVTEAPAGEATGRLATTGVDVAGDAVLHVAGGVDATIRLAFDRPGTNDFVIEGESGRIVLPEEFWQAQRVRRHAADGSVVADEAHPFRRNGFEYQVEEAHRCIALGLPESPGIPHEDTVATLRVIDQLRAQVGVRYPWEAGA